MIRSFRLRLALLSCLLSGLALGAFGFGSWWLIRDLRIERIDNDVRSHAEREVSRQRSSADWQRIEARMVSDLAVGKGMALLLVQDGAGSTVYRSLDWPDSLDAGRLSWPSAKDVAKQDGLSVRGNPPTRAVELTSKEPAAEGPGDVAPPSRPPVSIVVAKTIAGQPWHIGLACSDRARVAIAVDTSVVDADMAGVRNAFVLALLPVLIFIGLGSWALSERALHALQKLTATCRRVTAEGLDQRISAVGEDREFAELIEVFNGMLERLQRSFGQAHRFSADAAHELKTPLAILQGQLERAIQSVESGSAMQVELSSILDEVRRLSTISAKLLLLSQADAGRLAIHREPFALSQALEELVEDTRMLAPHLQVSSQILPGLVIQADGSLMRQILHNLISNAIKYNIEGGWICISSSSAPQFVEVIVSNASEGIPLADRYRIFERFYRADPAHGRKVEGVGLGLSVSREIARAHGGDLVLKANGEGRVDFAIRLPTTAIG